MKYAAVNVVIKNCKLRRTVIVPCGKLPRLFYSLQGDWISRGLSGELKRDFATLHIIASGRQVTSRALVANTKYGQALILDLSLKLDLNSL